MGLALLVLSACGKPAPTAETKDIEFAPVKIGLVVTTGGKGGDLAGPSLGAAAVAASHVKKDSGKKITIIEADYQGDLSLVEQLVSDLESKADVIIAATDDPAVLPALSKVRLPVIHPFITSEGVSGETRFRLAPSDALQAKRLAEFLVKRRGYELVGIIRENTEYGTSGAARFAEAVQTAGGTVVANAPFDTGGDIHTPVSIAADRGAQAVAVWTDDAAEAARVAIDVHRSSASYQLALPFNAAGPTFGKNAVAQVVPTAFREGILSIGPWAGPWLNAPRIARFYKDYEKRQNDVAPVRAAQVYDAVLMSSAARAKGEVADGLRSLKDFQGASVPVTFDQRNEGMDESDLWAWGFTKSKDGAGAEFFPAVDTGGGFFTLIPAGLEIPARFRYQLR